MGKILVISRSLLTTSVVGVSTFFNAVVKASDEESVPEASSRSPTDEKNIEKKSFVPWWHLQENLYC